MNELFNICLETLRLASRALHLADEMNRRESARTIFNICKYIAETGVKIMYRKAMNEKQLCELINTSLRLTELSINALKLNTEEYRLAIAKDLSKINNTLHQTKRMLLVNGISEAELAECMISTNDEFEQQRKMMN